MVLTTYAEIQQYEMYSLMYFSYCNNSIKPPGGLICQKQFCGWGLIQGEGLLNLEFLRPTKDNILYHISIWNTLIYM